MCTPPPSSPGPTPSCAPAAPLHAVWLLLHATFSCHCSICHDLYVVCGLKDIKASFIAVRQSKLILKQALSYCCRHHLSTHSQLHLGNFHVQQLCCCSCQNTFSSRYVHPVIQSHAPHEKDIHMLPLPGCTMTASDAASHPALRPEVPRLMTPPPPLRPTCSPSCVCLSHNTLDDSFCH